MGWFSVPCRLLAMAKFAVPCRPIARQAMNISFSQVFKELLYFHIIFIISYKFQTSRMTEQ
jgi:hypothetical protein